MAREPLTQAEITVERSRFYAAYYAVESDDELKAVLAARKKTYRKACHHCWASRLKSAEGQLQEQARDDGEVGRPGHKMLEVLRRHELYGLLVVSRIFGGVKLGPGNVGRAFARVAEETVATLQGR